MTSKHILYVHGQSTGTGRAEFSWPPLLVFVSSVALVEYRGRLESGGWSRESTPGAGGGGGRQCFSCSGLKAHFLLASRYGEETTTCLEVMKLGILEITQVFFFHGQITLLPVSNDIALLLGAQGKMKSVFQPELRGLLVEDSLKKLSSFPPK